MNALAPIVVDMSMLNRLVNLNTSSAYIHIQARYAAMCTELIT